MTNKTTAQKIADLFDNDGLVWETGDGQDLDTACKEHDPEIDQNWEREATRYTFADGSVITAAGAGWDFGYADCWCWEGNGHHGIDCSESPDYEEG